MKTCVYLLTFLVAVGLSASGTVALAEDAPAAEAPEKKQAPARAEIPDEKIKPTKTVTKPVTPDYRQALNRALAPGESSTVIPKYEAPKTFTLPTGRLYKPYIPLQTPSDEHIRNVLGHYSPGGGVGGSGSDYTGNTKSYELMQQQLQRRQTISSTLSRYHGISATGQASMNTLMNASRAASPASPIRPNGYRYVAPTSTTQPATSVTGLNPRLDRVARINAGLGTSRDLRRFQGLSNYDARTLANYAGYRNREYGTYREPAYSIPRAYQHKQMQRDIRYMKDSYGINVDPNRTTYSDLYRLRTGMTPR